MSCLYKTINLRAGESFILPPGAEIIAASDPNLITPLNDCVSLDNLDQIVCIEINWAVQPSTAAPPTSPWSINNNDTYCIGFGVDNTDYTFPSPVIGDAYASIKTSINDLADLNGLSGVVNCYQADDLGVQTNDRSAYSVRIRTIASLAPLLYLRFQVVDFDPVRIYGEVVSCPTT